MKEKVSYNDLALIAGNIGNLYDEGISLLNILSLIDELPLKKEYKSLLKEMEQVIKEGGSLCDGFNKGNDIIPNFFNSMIDIGEKTGKIVYVLKGLELFYNKLYYVRKTIIGALTYPMILIGALILLGIFVLFFFIPNMSNIYVSMGKQIPDEYYSIILFKERFLNNPIIVITQLSIIVVILPYFLVSNFLKDYISGIVNRIPIYNLINEYIVIMLMSVVINSGINIAIGLEYCCENELGKSINKNIKKINKDIISGKGLFQSMREIEMFSQYTLAHIKLGEESGSLDRRLKLLEEEIFKKVTAKINRLTQLIQPILIVFIGIIVVIFIIKFLMPLLDIVVI